MMTWILVANASQAKILSTEKLRVAKLELVNEFSHPDSRKKVTDLISDKPGHYKTDFGSGGAFSKNDPKEVEADHFAAQLANELKSARGQNRYNDLVIIAPAHFYGLIKKHLDSHIPEINHISKDYTKYNLEKLSLSLKEHLFG